MSEFTRAVWARVLREKGYELRQLCEGVELISNDGDPEEIAYRAIGAIRDRLHEYSQARHQLALIDPPKPPPVKKPRKRKQSWGLTKLGNQNLRLIVFRGGPFDKQLYYGTSPQAGTTVPFKFGGYRGRYVDGRWEENTATPHL